MNAIELHKTALFLFNTNIDEVKNIFNQEVEQKMLDHLLDKVSELNNSEKPNSSKWLNFILDLDEENLKILIDFIQNKF